MTVNRLRLFVTPKDLRRRTETGREPRGWERVVELSLDWDQLLRVT